MIDQVTSAETCRVCGAPLDDQANVDRICRNCAEPIALQGSYGAQWPGTAGSELEQAAVPNEEAPPDPDNPHWGPISGIGVWLMSVAAVIVIPVVAVLAWYLIQSVSGIPVPDMAAKDELLEWLKSPDLLLVQVLSTIVAHAIT